MLYFLFYLASSASIHGDLTLTGKVSCLSLDSPSIESKGSFLVDSSLTSNSISSTYISTDSLSIKTLKSPTGSITIEGNINLHPSSKPASAFLQTSWQSAHIETFSAYSDPWQSSDIKSCNGHFYIYGDCQVPSVSKSYLLPAHKYLRVSGILHLLDAWQGERMEIRADQDTIWSRIGHSNDKGVNVCGLEHPEAALSIRFDTMIAHSDSVVNISFFSNLSKKNCEASFGISEIELRVK